MRITSGAFLLFVLIPANAHALGPVGLEVAGKVGAGTNSTGFPPNPVGFGIGGRVGVVIQRFYAGLDGMYYFGSSATQCYLCNQLTVVSARSYQYGGELGYGYTISSVTIRGQVGVGDYRYDGAFSRNSLYLEPSLVGLFSFGPWLVGMDVGLLVTHDAGFVAHGQVGMTF